MLANAEPLLKPLPNIKATIIEMNKTAKKR